MHYMQKKVSFHNMEREKSAARPLPPGDVMLKSDEKIVATYSQIRFTPYKTQFIPPMWPEKMFYESNAKGKSNLLHWLEQKRSDMPMCFHSPAKICYCLV